MHGVLGKCDVKWRRYVPILIHDIRSRKKEIKPLVTTNIETIPPLFLIKGTFEKLMSERDAYGVSETTQADFEHTAWELKAPKERTKTFPSQLIGTKSKAAEKTNLFHLRKSVCNPNDAPSSPTCRPATRRGWIAGSALAFFPWVLS